MFNTVIFDVDGTLIDTEYVYVHSLQQTLQEVQHRTVPAEDLLFILGIPGMRALEKFTADPKERQHLFAVWLGHAAALKDHATVYPGIHDVLAALHAQGVTVGVATSKIHEEMQTEITRFGFQGAFDIVVTADMTAKHKPDPAPLLAVMAQLPETARAVYIGDAAPDLAAAHAARLPFALAEWGAHDAGQFAAADYRLAHPRDILPLVRS
ncbi:HAD family hydrolase [Schleiferilactobacillus harbinensis]|uniref:HAD family hydrolase n=1 Tax=Schleiferilactobacillus harbinensis TaxID=304207 RepID=UPI0039EA2FA9